MLNWQAEQNGSSALRCLAFSSASRRLVDESLLCLLCPIALTEGLRQLVDVQSELQLGNGLAPQRIERRLLLGGERPGNAIEYTETPKRMAIMRDQRRSHVEADPAARRQRAGCRGSARRPAYLE